MSITNSVDITTRYTYRVTWSVEDEEYVATCLELPSLSWLADTQEGALRGLRELVVEAVQDMGDNQEAVPEPLSSRAYSGKFNLRVGERLHRKLATEAAQGAPEPQPVRSAPSDKRLLTTPHCRTLMPLSSDRALSPCLM